MRRHFGNERAVPVNFAAIVRRDDAGDDLDERGFARAVLADQRVRFTAAQPERDVVQDLNARIRLIQISDLQNVLF